MKEIREKYDARFLAFILLLASAMGLAAGSGKGWIEGVAVFAIVMGGWLVIPLIPWSGLELLQKNERDERQGLLGIEAMAIAGGVMMLVALGGAIVDLAHSRAGEFQTMCVVGGVAFLIACLVLPRVRH